MPKENICRLLKPWNICSLKKPLALLACLLSLRRSGGTHLSVHLQPRKTTQTRDFDFLNFRSLNNRNLLLESGEYSKAK